MYGQLIPLHGGDPIALTGPTLTVGRASACDIVVRHRSISGRHCRLLFRDGAWIIVDLGSLNGTFIGRRRCEKARVKSDSIVRLGTVRFQLVYGKAPGNATTVFAEGNNPAARSGAGPGDSDVRPRKRAAAQHRSQRSPDAASRRKASQVAPENTPQSVGAGPQPENRPVKRFLGKLTPAAGGDVIPLLEDQIVIGRGRDCGIRLKFSTVSTNHCKMQFRDGYWFVQDMASRNGIRINGESVHEGWLLPGATLSVGKFRFEISYQPKSDEPPPALDPLAGGSLLEKAGLARELEGDRTPDWLKSDQDPDPVDRIDLESL